ncbi:MAG: AAA family ATPase [Oscillospiraceae bacterium]|nr:AAA family ATPase [Oscillospiraceae bacterium]
MVKKSKFDVVAEQVKALITRDSRYTELSIYLNEVRRNPEKNPFGSAELLAELAERILGLKKNNDIKQVLDDAEEIYSTVIPLGRMSADYELLKAVFLKIFDKDGIYTFDIFSPALYSSFNDKRIYIDVMNSLLYVHSCSDNLEMIEKYASSARQYFTDERAFGAAVINAANRLSLAQDKGNVINELIMLAERAAGIYDVSEERLSTVNDNAEKAERLFEMAQKELAASERHAQSYKALAEKCESSLKTVSDAENKNIRSEAAAAIMDVKRAYEEMLSKEQKRLDFDKDKLLRDLMDSADKKIRELRMVSESIKEQTSAELYRINTEASKAAERAASILQTDELQDMIKELNRTEGLIEKIIHVDEFSRKFNEDSIIIKSIQQDGIPEKPMIIQDTAAQRYSAEPDMTVNFFFNESVSFEDRMQELIRLKNKDIYKNGALYHERFDDILTAVIEDSNPYIIGPSGCGKTYLVEQIAALLGVEFLDIGYINEEYDIIGFQTASGGYNYPAFYRAYKYGGIVFCDEFDNSNSRAAVKLNSFMSSGENAGYCFPNGELVKRHPNFRIIAAGNTAGSGADRNYSTREKIEESVQQRFMAMYVNYDNRLEKEILAEYPKWFEFAVQFRAATDKWSRANDCSAPGIFTTRDSAAIKKYLDHKSFDELSILNYEFIETKDTEYLLFIVKCMEQYYAEPQESSALFEMFKNRVSEIVENGGIR